MTSWKVWLKEKQETRKTQLPRMSNKNTLLLDSFTVRVKVMLEGLPNLKIWNDSLCVRLWKRVFDWPDYIFTRNFIRLKHQHGHITGQLVKLTTQYVFIVYKGKKQKKNTKKSVNETPIDTTSLRMHTSCYHKMVAFKYNIKTLPTLSALRSRFVKSSQKKSQQRIR